MKTELNNSNKALVGFSINSELYITYDGRTKQEKAPLESITTALGGTSANVAIGIKTLGGNSKMLGLTGENGGYSTHMLQYVLQNCEVPSELFPILDESHIAVWPNDRIHNQRSFGKKGQIVKDKLVDTLAAIEKQSDLWRIATGVRVEEFELVMCLFNKSIGFRSLNPRMELIQKKQVFRDLLKHTDLLIMNLAEYQACEVTSPEKLHKYGPSLIIITDKENGGMYSHRDTGAKRFKACTDYIQRGTHLYEIGTGDWFHAGFAKKCQGFGKPYSELTPEEFLDFVNFGARVAGKKVTMFGAANGPTMKELVLEEKVHH